ncbi:MAG: 5'-nucleotidase C-terminal domain-containing protein [Chitinophagales bacterium]|nr:5'-nucleotidase C-terminal domain-containing protein [Chitinophagales bacterium]
MKWLRYISIVFCIELLLACSTLQLTHTEAQHIVIEHNEGIDSSLNAFIQVYKFKLDEKMNDTVAILNEDLFKVQPSSNLTNMMADIVYDYYLEKNIPIDMAITNYGGIRVPSISKGVLQVKDAYELMPFDNELVLMEIPGNVLEQLLQHSCLLGAWPVSHAQIVMNASNELSSVLIAGQAIQKDKLYRVGTINYIAEGGDQCSFLIPLKAEKSGRLFRDEILKYWKKYQNSIPVDNSKRVQYE